MLDGQPSSGAEFTKSVTRGHVAGFAQFVTQVMLTGNTKRVTNFDMTCVEIINRWGVSDLAKDLGIPSKNVRRWVDFDSIPAEWFAAMARAAELRGHADITVERLAEIAEARRLAKAEARSEAA